MIDPELSIEERIKDIIRREIDEYNVDTEQKLATLDAFRAAQTASVAEIPVDG